MNPYEDAYEDAYRVKKELMGRIFQDRQELFPCHQPAEIEITPDQAEALIFLYCPREGSEDRYQVGWKDRAMESIRRGQAMFYGLKIILRDKPENKGLSE